MHPESVPSAPGLDDPGAEAVGIALAYRQAAHGDVWSALVTAIGDALSAQAEAEQRIGTVEHLISHGYVRGRIEVG